MLDDELTESPLEGDFHWNPRADLVAQRRRIADTEREMMLMRTPDEIKQDIAAVDVDLANLIGQIEDERKDIREAAKKAMSEIGKAKRAAAARKAKLVAEYGAAVLDEAD